MRELLNIAQRQIAVAIDQQNQQVTDELKRLSADAAAKGYQRSGRFIVERDRRAPRRSNRERLSYGKYFIDASPALAFHFPPNSRAN